MKRKLLILPLLVALLIACALPAIASNTESNGVAVTDGVGAPGGKVRMQVSIPSTFTDNVGLVITVDEAHKDLLKLSDESQWLLAVDSDLQDVHVHPYDCERDEETEAIIDENCLNAVESGYAIWAPDAKDVQGDVFELVFDISENAELGAELGVTVQLKALWDAPGQGGTTVTSVQREGIATAVVTVKEQAKISGTVTSYIYMEENEPVTVELLNSDGEVVNTDVLEGEEATYEFSVGKGEYVVRAKRTKHCPREYAVSMEDMEDKVQDIEIRIYGDVNGDGTVTSRDLVQLKKYSADNESIIGEDAYLAALGDVNGDESVTSRDLVQLKKFSAGNESSLDQFE